MKRTVKSTNGLLITLTAILSLTIIGGSVSATGIKGPHLQKVKLGKIKIGKIKFGKIKIGHSQKR